MTANEQAHAPETKGLAIRSGVRGYDLLAWILTLGREGAFRDRIVELAGIAPGDAVLDVGCGTGTQAIAAKRRVGANGTVVGVDASPEMIERARTKARESAADVSFEVGVIEALPFPDRHFDVVLSTLMIHHLPRPLREQGAREMLRVLKPGGRLLAVDFATPPRERKGLFARLHRHGAMKPQDIVAVIESAGMNVLVTGATGVADVHYVLAAPSEPSVIAPAVEMRSLAPLPTPRWVIPALVVLAILAHGAVFGVFWSRVAVSIAALVAVLFLVVAMHLPIAARLHGRRR